MIDIDKRPSRRRPGPRGATLFRYARFPAVILAAILAIAVGPAAASSASTVPATVSAASHARASGPIICLYCATIAQASWHYDGDGTGTVTVQGTNFTPGGPVAITYDYGSGQYQQVVYSTLYIWYCSPAGYCYRIKYGEFTATENGIPCGAIPGRGDVGVIVDAFDLTSGQDPSESIPTPCY